MIHFEKKRFEFALAATNFVKELLLNNQQLIAVTQELFYVDVLLQGKLIEHFRIADHWKECVHKFSRVWRPHAVQHLNRKVPEI